MKAFLTSPLFLIIVLLAICLDHAIRAILAHNYGKTVLYAVLCLFLLIVLIILLL